MANRLCWMLFFCLLLPPSDPQRRRTEPEILARIARVPRHGKPN